MRIRQHFLGADIERRFPSACAALLLVCLFSMWLPQLETSLWLDETQTFWVIQGSLPEVIAKSATQGQSPLYFAFQSLFSQFAGTSELALRLPAVVAGAISLWCLFKIGELLCGRRAGLLAALFFAASLEAVSTVVNARPYSFALAAALGSILALFRWLEQPKMRTMLVYVLSAACMIYFHYLFACALAVHAAAWVLFRRLNASGGPQLSLPQFAAALLLIALLVIPAGQHISAYAARQTDLNIAAPPAFSSLVFVLLFPSLLFPMFIALGVGSVLFPVTAGLRDFMRAAFSRTGAFLGFWYAAPPAALFVLSHLGPGSVFVARYWVWSLPAFAIFCGWLAASLRPLHVTLLLAALYVGAAFLLFPAGAYHSENWRAASAFANSLELPGESAVLFYPGLVETRRVSWLEDPAMARHLRSPLLYYPVDNESVVLPADLDTSQRADYWKRRIEPVLARSDQQVLYVLNNRLFIREGEVQSLAEYYQQKLESYGFEPIEVRFFDRVAVALFKRRRRLLEDVISGAGGS